MTDTRLKNCPFCGGEAGLRNTLAERKASSPTSAYVICESCLASTSYFEGSTCVSKAISAWNRRTPPADVPDGWRDALEHVTELLVDTWHHQMDGDPEEQIAVK